MLKIVISEQDLNNLKTFLSRVNLVGKEVPAFNEILAAVYGAVPVEKVKEGGENNGLL